jgi:PAS domain S-box-containing protein
MPGSHHLRKQSVTNKGKHDDLLRSVVLRNAHNAMAVRQRAQQEVIDAREALRIANDRIVKVLESITDGFSVLDSEWRFTYINSRALTILAPLGVTRDKVIGKVLWDVLPDLQGSELDRQCRLALATQQTVSFEFFFPPLTAWFDFRVYPSADGLTGYFQDITPRKIAEDTLRQSEEMLRALADSIPQLAWSANADGYVVWFNQRWYQYTGCTPEQSLGWEWQHAHSPEVLPQARALWSDSIRAGVPFEMEVPIRGADGQYRWFLTRVNPLHDKDGKPARWFGTSTDVDQVKRVQQALREETQVLELLNSTGSALASQRDLRSLLQTVTNATTIISGARFGVFYYRRAGQDGADLPLYTLSGNAPPAFAEAGEQVATALDAAARDGRSTMRCDDIENTAAHLSACGLQSCLSVPVVARSGEQLGSLFFGHPEPDMFSKRTERIIEGIAAQAAVAIDNTRLYEAARRAADEREKLLESEKLARAEAERTSQMKDEFLATLSHELRTPLSAILGWAQVLRRGSRDPNDLQRGLQTIERNARAQAQLIEDLLDVSRITSGKVLLDIHAVAPSVMVDAAIETVRPAADAKQIRIERLIDPHVPFVAADPGRLQQVIWNLLSNAIKFTPRGGAVLVQLRAAEGHIEFTVSDNGIGIKPEFIDHVFERFRQADSSTTRKHGGLGLGLSIVKQLVEQHGGTVRVDSEGEGCGATFTLQLPIATRPPPVSRSEPAAQASPALVSQGMRMRDLSGAKVLVVDDEPDARELIKRILSDCHASVIAVGSAAEALDWLESAQPDLLVSDLGMADIDGFELLARVRALDGGKWARMPAIALTAFARHGDRVRALEAGFHAHIAKPVEPSELIATVAKLVGERTS